MVQPQIIVPELGMKSKMYVYLVKLDKKVPNKHIVQGVNGKK